METVIIKPFKGVGEFDNTKVYEIQGNDEEHVAELAYEYSRKLLKQEDNIWEYRWNFKEGIQGHYVSDFQKWMKLKK